MEWKSRLKLIEQGFIVIRTSNHPQPRIIKATEAQSWVTLEKFSTKAERDRAANNMVEDDDFVILEERE